MTQHIVPVASLGPATFASPLDLSTRHGDGLGNYVCHDSYVRYQIELSGSQTPADDPLFEKAGPRERLYFDPSKTKAAIVTCGGLCPGLNNVIRSVLHELYYNYGVKETWGVRYGYKGLNPAHQLALLRITPDFVDGIDARGGTVLGTSRGREEADVMVDTLEREGIDLLFTVGGDGTQRGAHRLGEEIARRRAKIAVVGIPKTIDNDVPYCQMTFGYVTAIDVAREVLLCAHNEAKSAFNGVGLVKVMGRDAGFIAAGATLASQEVNFTLIPEVPFRLEGEGGFLNALRQRILSRRHAVIVVAEGAGQNLFETTTDDHDASGNIRYQDIGLYMKDRIKAFFEEQSIPLDLKYIDPSYVIRSAPANCYDSFLCDQLARGAVHAAMAGKTDLMLGFWNNAFIHVPISMATGVKKQVDPEGRLWTSVLAATGQAKSYA
jgi:6-phosphofructokinase 1